MQLLICLENNNVSISLSVHIVTGIYGIAHWTGICLPESLESIDEGISFLGRWFMFAWHAEELLDVMPMEPSHDW